MARRRIGPRLRMLREDRGLDVGQLAYKAKVHQSTIHKIEAGDRPNTSGVILAQLADALNTTVDYLLGRTNDPSPILKTSDASAKVHLYVSELLELWRQLEVMAPDRLDAAVNSLVTQTELLLAVIEAERKRNREREPERHPESEP